ncbi:MAG TPA: peptidase, partial [Fibrella sp.]
MKKTFLAVMACALVIAACDDKKNTSSATTQTESVMVAAPTFSADSAYDLIKQQIAFGPRVPNTPAHVRGGDYIVAKLKEYGVDVIEQPFTAKGWDGTIIKGRNIIGIINPMAEKRLLFASHWDSRPRADQ